MTCFWQTSFVESGPANPLRGEGPAKDIQLVVWRLPEVKS